MITYESGIEQYILNRLSKQKDAIETKKKDFLILLPSLCNEDKKRHLATTLTKKVFVLYEEIWKNDPTLQSSIASLRYILEALIQTELLYKESDYFEKIYHSVLKHKINKTQTYLEKVKSDCLILEAYEKKEDIIKEKYKKGMDEHQINDLMQQEDQIYDDLDYELTISLDASEFNSLGVQKMMLEQNVIPSLEKGIEEMKKELDDLSKALAIDLEFNRKFQIRGQSTRVPKVLKDSRSWSKKASDAGLENEYQFVYGYTSSLLHCTSFSILTNLEIEKSEFVTIRSLANKYMARIFDRLYEFCNMPKNM